MSDDSAENTTDKIIVYKHLLKSVQVILNF